MVRLLVLESRLLWMNRLVLVGAYVFLAVSVSTGLIGFAAWPLVVMAIAVNSPSHVELRKVGRIDTLVSTLGVSRRRYVRARFVALAVHVAVALLIVGAGALLLPANPGTSMACVLILLTGLVTAVHVAVSIAFQGAAVTVARLGLILAVAAAAYWPIAHGMDPGVVAAPGGVGALSAGSVPLILLFGGLFLVALAIGPVIADRRYRRESFA